MTIFLVALNLVPEPAPRSLATALEKQDVGMKQTNEHSSIQLTPRQVKSRLDKVYKAMRTHGKHPHHFYELYYLNEQMHEKKAQPAVFGWSNNGRASAQH